MLSFSTKCSKHKPSLLPSDPQSLFLSPSHTHPHTNALNHAQTLTSHPMTPSICFAVGLLLQLLTDFLVFLQSRKASEQAKSVDSKTDSIGSGRAIPIKQVSSFPHFLPYISLSCLGKYEPLPWVIYLLFVCFFSLMWLWCVSKIYTVGPGLTCLFEVMCHCSHQMATYYKKTRQYKGSSEVEKIAGG